MCSTQADHEWAELRGKNRADGSQRCVVLDPWAQGSAIEAEHSRYAADDAGKRVIFKLLSREAAHAVLREVQAGLSRAANNPELLAEISRELESNYQQCEPFLAEILTHPLMLPEALVESDAFIAEVRAAEERLRQAGAAAGNAAAEP